MNHRNFTRVDFSEFASIRFEDKVYFGNVINISLQGLFVKTHEDIPLNTSVDVTVYHSSNHSIRLSVSVLRQDSTGVAMQIRKMDSNSFARLKNIIAKRCFDHELIRKETARAACCIC